MTDDIPQWAIDRARQLSTVVLREQSPTGEVLPGSFDGRNVCATAFARYIAEHEEPPVDPLHKEACKLIEDWYNAPRHGPNICINFALLALKRGIEIGESM